MKPMSFQMSVDAKTLADFLRKLPPGASVSYAEMSALVKRDVAGDARHILHRAREVLLREGVRFDVVRGTGVRRMADSEVARSGAQSVAKVGRTARREMKKMTALTDFNSLSNEDKVHHNATISVLGAVAHFSKPAQVKILEAAVAQVQRTLPVAGTLDTLRRSLAPKAA